MTRHVPSILAFFVLLTLAGPAAADIVHLKNGRQIRGTIVKETSEKLVVKTHIGPMEIPRRDVKRVERESQAKLLLAQGRQAAKDGDRAKARKLLQKAAAAGDSKIKKLAEKELEQLGKRTSDPLPARGRARRRVKVPGWDGRSDPFQEVEREAYFRELEEAAKTSPALASRLVYEFYKRGKRRHELGQCRLAASDFRRGRSYAAAADTRRNLKTGEYRCRLEVASRALRQGQSKLAYLAAKEVVSDKGTPTSLRPRAHFFYGRGCELTNRQGRAKEQFQLAIGPRPTLPKSRDLATFRELARLASAGIKLNASSPGVGRGWSWARTKHFAILHQIENDPRLGARFEAHRAAVIRRLKLRSNQLSTERVAVFIFATQASYRQSPGARGWAAGHASRLRTQEDDMIRGIYLYKQKDMHHVVRHEIAHILVGDALKDALIPAWSNEGAAIYAEPEASRNRWRGWGRLLHARGQLRPLEAALAQMLPPLTGDTNAVRRFYVQAALSFSLLADRVGVERALSCAQRINKQGPKRALRSVGLSLRTLEARQKSALEGRRK